MAEYCESQEAIKAGCRRKIRNGVTINVWNVRWLSDLENGFLTPKIPIQLQHITVASLMDTNRTLWDYDVLRDIYNNRDIGLIKRISIPAAEKNDS